MPLEEREKRRTSGRCWKLPVTFVGLLGWAAAILALLFVTGASLDEITWMGAVPLKRLWLLAALGGALGGVARALYSFLFDNYAFHFWVTTGRSSPFIQKMCGGIKDIEDDFDPLEGWHLFFVKPLLGSTLGLLLALVIDLGLISLVNETSADSAERAPLRATAIGGLAGLFAENVLHRMRRLVPR